MVDEYETLYTEVKKKENEVMEDMTNTLKENGRDAFIKKIKYEDERGTWVGYAVIEQKKGFLGKQKEETLYQFAIKAEGVGSGSANEIKPPKDKLAKMVYEKYGYHLTKAPEEEKATFKFTKKK